MTAIRTGDRVKVKIDAVGTLAYRNDGGTLEVQLDGWDDGSTLDFIPPEYVEKIPEPAKGGDIVTGLPDLPVGSVVLELDRSGNEYRGIPAAVWTRHDDGWRPGGGSLFARGVGYLADEGLTFRILHIVPTA